MTKEFAENETGDPGGTRTLSLQFRRLMLCPVELLAVGKTVAPILAAPHRKSHNSRPD